MKKRIRILCYCLIFVLALNLCACGRAAGNGERPSAPSGGQTGGPVVAAPETSTETVPGYISTEIDMPDWIDSFDYFGSCEIVGDSFFLVAHLKDGGTAIAHYNTLTDRWQRYDFDTGEALYPSVDLFSATEDSLWLLLREGRSDEEIESHNYSRSLAYYLTHVDLNTGEQRCKRLDFWHEGDAYLCALIALDSGRALLGDGETALVLSREAEVLERPDLAVMGMGAHAWIGGELYITTPDGYARLDAETLRYDEPMPELTDRAVYSSSPGSFLVTVADQLCNFDPATGEMSPVYDWLDVALSYSRLYGFDGLENTNGDIYHLTDTLIKVSPGQVPLKKTLILGCF